MTQVVDAPTDFDVWAVPLTWEAMGDAGKALADATDKNRWKIGDLARRVTQEWEEESLHEYASRISVEYGTLNSYRKVSTFYEDESIRVDFGNLSWSHYRACMRLGALDTALDMLSEASALNWSARDLTDALNTALGKPAVKRALLEVEIVGDNGSMAFQWDGIEDGKRYLVKVYAAGDES